MIILPKDLWFNIFKSINRLERQTIFPEAEKLKLKELKPRHKSVAEKCLFLKLAEGWSFFFFFAVFYNKWLVREAALRSGPSQRRTDCPDGAAAGPAHRCQEQAQRGAAATPPLSVCCGGEEPTTTDKPQHGSSSVNLSRRTALLHWYECLTISRIYYLILKPEENVIVAELCSCSATMRKSRKLATLFL